MYILVGIGMPYLHLGNRGINICRRRRRCRWRERCQGVKVVGRR